SSRPFIECDPFAGDATAPSRARSLPCAPDPRHWLRCRRHRDREGIRGERARGGVLRHVARPAARAAVAGVAGRRYRQAVRARCAEEDFLNPRVIVSGALDEWSDRRLRELYRPWPDVPVRSMSLRSAEGTKYAANLFNAAKISFFNELEQLFDTLGVDARS